MKEILDKLQAMGAMFEEYKTANNQRLEEIAKTGQASIDSVGKMAKIETDMEATRDRISVLEADLRAAALQRDIDDHVNDDERAHTRAFNHWLRNPKSASALDALSQAKDKAVVSRLDEDDVGGRQMAITITGTGGGNLIPTEVAARILQKIYDMSPIRRLANVTRSGNENLRFIVMDADASGGWVGAGGTRNETNTPTFNAFTLTYGTNYAYPQVYEEAMNDLDTNVEDMVENFAAKILAQQESEAFLTGDGSSKPTGLLDGTPVATGDEASPARAFQTLQYFPTGAAAGFQNDMTGSPAGDPASCLFDLVYGIKKEYRQNANFMMNRSTLSTVRQFRDADGNYLYIPGLVQGQPDRLLGYNVEEGEQMPDIGANAFPIAFGDFNEGYQIGDIVNTLRITVDDNITAPGFVKFYIRKRTGGNVANDDAIKLLKCATS